MSLGLALSGGGAKGAAHIGVLQALKDEGINVDYISGTSSGSIVATLYACGYNPYNILYMFNTYCKYISDYDKALPFKLIGTIFTGKLKVKGLAKGNNLEKIVRDYCKSKQVVDITDIMMPIAVPTVDISSGEIVYFLNRSIQNRLKNREYDDIPSYITEGDIASIVRASSSFPAVFEPKLIGDKLLVDGGVRINSPVTILKEMGATKVITVTFDANIRDTYTHSNIVDLAMKSFDIMGHQVNMFEIENADLVLQPRLANVSLLDGEKSNEFAKIGYDLTMKHMELIKEMIKE